MKAVRLLFLILYYTFHRGLTLRYFVAAISVFWAHCRRRNTCKVFGKTIHFSHWEQVATPILEWVRGFYEFPLPQGGLVIDCGANIGMLGILLHQTDPTLNVEAYEPHPTIFRLLESNQTGPGGVSQSAIATEDGYSELWLDKTDYVTGSTLCSKKNEETVRVATRSLAKLINNRKVDLLKIDIEGFEFDLLVGNDLDFRSVHYLYLEVHPGPNRSMAALIGRLEKDFRLRFFSDYRPTLGFQGFSNLVIYGEQIAA